MSRIENIRNFKYSWKRPDFNSPNLESVLEQAQFKISKDQQTMKKITSVLFGIFLTFTAFGQDAYSEAAANELLQKYTALKDQAKEVADYATAAKYKEKIDALNALESTSDRLKKAVEDEDFQLATTLQKDLQQGWDIINGRIIQEPETVAEAPQTQTKTRGTTALGRYLNPVATTSVTPQKKEKVVRPAATTSQVGGPRIYRHDVSTLNLSNLQMGESVTLTGQVGTYLQFMSTPLEGIGEIYADHGPIGGLNVGMGYFDPANAGYDLSSMSLHLGGGYAVNIDAYTAFASIELTALAWSVLDPDFAGQEATSNFAAFPQGGAALRLGAKVRPFFKENSRNAIGSRYKSFHAYIDAPLGGGQGMFSLGFTSTIFK